MKRGQLLTADDARPAKEQHTRPCSDCPWARRSLRGWLGSLTGVRWLHAAHGESRIDCHTILDKQCAGAAIYRANVAKMCRSADHLRLPPDRETVFATKDEFLSHHRQRRRDWLDDESDDSLEDDDDYDAGENN